MTLLAVAASQSMRKQAGIDAFLMRDAARLRES
jgi:hypothetical protein